MPDDLATSEPLPVKRKRNPRVKKNCNYVLTPTAIKMMQAIADYNGLSPSSQMELMIRERYRRLKHKFG